MPKRNWPLIIGVALAISFLVLAIVGPALAPQDPLQTNLYLKIEGSIRLAPVAPGVVPGYWLGTDEAGRDVLSRILWGIRPTLVVCVVVALARLAVGVLIGLAAGWFRGPTERVIDTVGSIGVGLPALVLAIALINFLGVAGGLRTFVIALTIVGWIEVANLVKSRTLTVVQAPYIESARALGVGPWGVVRRHLLPQLRPLLPVLLAFELSAALLLLTELGFLGIFIGGGTTYQFDTGGIAAIPVLTADQPELAQQISRFWTKFYRVPWEFLAVGAVIFAQIVAFNLVGEGLRRRLDVTQPRRRRWLHVPDRVLDRVPQLGWRWIPVGAAVAALLVGGWWVGRVRPEAPTPIVQSNAPEPFRVTPVVSTQPLTVQQINALADFDLPSLLAVPEMFPDGLSAAEPTADLPAPFVDMPTAVQSRTYPLQQGNTAVGGATVLFYPSVEDRDGAFNLARTALLGAAETNALAEDEIPVVGERSLTINATTFPVAGPDAQVIFVRCGTVAHVRVTPDVADPTAAATFIAQSLDARLLLSTCQTDGTVVLPQPSTTSTVASTTQLETVDLKALFAQPGVVPGELQMWQDSERTPDQLRNVFAPLQAYRMDLRTEDRSVEGEWQVVLYPTLQARDQAVRALLGGLIDQDRPPDLPPSPLPIEVQPALVGERSFTQGIVTPKTTGASPLVFVRCGAIAQLELSFGAFASRVTLPTAQLVYTSAKALDAQLSAVACGQQQTDDQAISPPTGPSYGTAPRSVDELQALDLEALLAQPGLLPQNMTIGQVSERVPDQFRDVPEPVQVRNFNLKELGVSAGNIVVLLYGSLEERDQAAQTMADAIRGQDQFVPFDGSPPPSPAPQPPDAPPVAGDRSYTFGLLPPGTTFEGDVTFFGPQQVVFARCGAVVQVRPSGGSGFTVSDQVDEGLAAIVRVLDEQLTPVVCQPQGAPAAQASSSTASLGAAPRNADELRALDWEALVQQIALPETMSIGQVSERVPDEFRDVPEPVVARNFNLKRSGVSGGNIIVLVYGSSDEGNSVFDTLTGGEAIDGEMVEIDPSQLPPGTTIISAPPVPAIGERTSGFFSEITFVRCGMVVQVRLVEGDEAPAIAQALDAQLAPLVCQSE